MQKWWKAGSRPGSASGGSRPTTPAPIGGVRDYQAVRQSDEEALIVDDDDEPDSRRSTDP